MTCNEIESLLFPYLDGEIGDDDKLELERHFSQCRACAQRLHQEKSQALSLKRLLSEAATQNQAPLHLRERVQQGWLREQRQASMWYWSRMGAAAATLVIVSTTGYSFWLTRSREKHVESAAVHHAKSFPLEIQQPSSEQIEAWFGGKLTHPVRLPRWQQVRPAGARLLNVQDKQAAYVRYDPPAIAGPPHGALGLFVYEDEKNDVAVEAQPVKSTSHGYNVVSWRQGDVVYQLVTDLDESDVLKLLLDEKKESYLSAPEPTFTPAVSVQPANFEPL